MLILRIISVGYYVTFPHDTQVNKTIAFTIFTLETIQTALLTRDLYLSFVMNFGNAEFLEQIGLMWLVAPVLCGIGEYLFVWITRSI